MNFKIVVSEPDSRKSYQLEIEQEKASFLIGKKIGDEIDGSLLGLPGYVLKISGGSDKDGFPMVPFVEGPLRASVVLEKGPGYKPKKKGVRKRKTVRGNTISMDIVQINTKVIKKGEKSLEELIPKKEKK
ncbi:MAG: 30S ribosomal protein S6e [Candidatus Aenigmarchaeota archaeon]|nr:30S ribosomal protein S6e [Candidatus Aenigmarchaeota archaeon]MDW8149713.1 30S ribosomal protein S6e [Candidatus Aenigmarchaeota archaeon]